MLKEIPYTTTQWCIVVFDAAQARTIGDAVEFFSVVGPFPTMEAAIAHGTANVTDEFEWDVTEYFHILPGPRLSLEERMAPFSHGGWSAHEGPTED